MKNSSTIITNSLKRVFISVGNSKLHHRAGAHGFFLGRANFQRRQAVLRRHDGRLFAARHAIDKVADFSAS